MIKDENNLEENKKSSPIKFFITMFKLVVILIVFTPVIILIIDAYMGDDKPKNNQTNEQKNQENGKTPTPKETKESKRIDLEEEWKKQTADAEEKYRDLDIKNKPMKIDKYKLDTMVEILNSLPEKQIDQQHKACIESKEHSQYISYLNKAFVIYYTNKTNEEKLIDMLSKKCPDGMRIEVKLALSDFDNPVSILHKSYNMAAGDSKKRILWRINKAFPSLRSKIKDDDEFVDACNKWYLENKDQLRVNIGYLPVDTSAGTVIDTELYEFGKDNFDIPWNPDNQNSVNQPDEKPITLEERWLEKTKDAESLKKDQLKYRTVQQYKEKVTMELLEDLSKEQLEKEFQNFLKTPKEMNEFQRYLNEAFFNNFLETKNTEMLIGLLSKKCPNIFQLEFNLALSELDNPIDIMYKSYLKADEDSKRRLFRAFESAFPNLRKQYEDDDAFVEACNKWYLENKDTYILNIKYKILMNAPSLEHSKKQELFKLKSEQK